jgi:ADP-ribosylglycohydrolase
MLQHDYAQRVYAGVLGKMVGVYLGRPFENWRYERIMQELGEISGYVHERLNCPLIVTDDDLSGTFRFIRALDDVQSLGAFTAAHVGHTWLNLLIEGRSVLWWGGMGMSTEHTAYERLKRGMLAPESGSIRTNGRTVAEQIGAQIFIDGWAMLCPGDPHAAAALARAAASVSHDGEAIYAAQVIAVMEALAFTTADIDTLIESALAFIPPDSMIRRVIDDIRGWHAQIDDWRICREKIDAQYGYHRFAGHCHVVPNHALIVMALLYGAGDFDRSLMIVNTSGWDTDCNSGNLGCLLGIRGGLTIFDPDTASTDWITPIADRLYLTSADTSTVVTDAAREADYLVARAHHLRGLVWQPPKNGARFHFAYPHSVQGFSPHSTTSAQLDIRNAPHPDGDRVLALRYDLNANDTVCAITPTFIPPEAIHMVGYALNASPALYAGQTVTAEVSASAMNTTPVVVRLCAEVYLPDESVGRIFGDPHAVTSTERVTLSWTIPDTHGLPIAGVGLAITAHHASHGEIALHWLTHAGSPHTALQGDSLKPDTWQRAWVNAADHFGTLGNARYSLRHGAGMGMLLNGASDWHNYTITARIASPMMQAGGVAVRVQGLRRYLAVMLASDQHIHVVSCWDETTQTLLRVPFAWETDRVVTLRVRVHEQVLTLSIDDQAMGTVHVADSQFSRGAVALVVSDGCLLCDTVDITT